MITRQHLEELRSEERLRKNPALHRDDDILRNASRFARNHAKSDSDYEERRNHYLSRNGQRLKGYGKGKKDEQEVKNILRYHLIERNGR